MMHVLNKAALDGGDSLQASLVGRFTRVREYSGTTVPESGAVLAVSGGREFCETTAVSAHPIALKMFAAMHKASTLAKMATCNTARYSQEGNPPEGSEDILPILA
ncbi:unnamed protein product [Symbiodinium natans]|uniref:Uncharacterized protein n=1 Tax=Symbiodinium natans TaxID=878477 RepID=A0A812UW80_9DINO|nr:unnamed protein product [Symbiodinium natans]